MHDDLLHRKRSQAVPRASMTAVRSGPCLGFPPFVPRLSPLGELDPGSPAAHERPPFYDVDGRVGHEAVILRVKGRSWAPNVACRTSIASQSQDVRLKQAWGAQRPLLANSRRLRAHMGHSMMDPCVVKRHRWLIRGRERQSFSRVSRMSPRRLMFGRAEMFDPNREI